MSKPRVLVLGGVGFIGRNFVKYLVENNLCSKIRVVDKALPATSHFNKATEAAFNNPVVEYKQGNLSNPSTVSKVFADEGGKWTYVFNLAAETRYSQTDEIYKEKVLDLSVHCGKEAAAHGVEKFVEVSTAQVYKSEKKASSEGDKTKPWTNVAKYKLQAEEALKAIPNLPVVIVRPAIVYGPGDVSGLAPRIICGAVYTELKEEMSFLWGGDLRINTVHVSDVCRALWFLAQKGTPREIYNLADKNDTDQKKINTILESIFHIKTGFAGVAISQMAKLAMKTTTEVVNDKHLKPWSDLCKRAGITNTPLSPYLDEELLSDNHLAVDGSKIESLGFKYEVPHVTEALIRESIAYFQDQGLFPAK